MTSLKDDKFGEITQKFSIFRDVVCQWLLVHWNDFEEDNSLLEKRLVALLDSFVADPSLEPAVSKIHVFLSTARQYRSGPSIAPAGSLLPSILPKNMPCPLRKVHPEELARQITILQWQVFSRLNLSRAIPFLGPNSTSNTAPSQTPTSTVTGTQVHVLDDYMSATPWTPFGDWNNFGGHLQRWAATNVCTVPKPSERSKMLHFMIEVSYFLYKLSNYDGCYRILEGLKLLALPSTWSSLSSKIRNVHENLTNALRQLFADVRRITAAPYPHIPIVETFTNALQQIGLKQPRFRAPIGATGRNWVETSASSRNLRVSAPEKEHSKRTIGRSTSSSEMTVSPPTDASSSADSSTDSSEMRLNMTRAHAEALLLSRLRSFQSKPFPFSPVSWIADFVSHANPLSIWTIQEYCETLEPTKYSQPVATRRNVSSPRHISKTTSTPASPRAPHEISPPPSPRPESPDSSPRGWAINFSPQTTDWVDYESAPNSPNSSPPKPMETSTGAAPSAAAPSNAPSNPGHSNASFNHRRPLHRNASPIELELERLGFYVFSSPPIADLPAVDPSSKSPPRTNWWALLDEDRLADSEEDLLPQLLLEYLPLPSWESLFMLTPIKAAFLNMKTSKLTAKFKEASQMKFRRDFCFAAPAHNKRIKLSSYRFTNLEAPRHIPVTHTVTLTNPSSSAVEFECCPAAPLSQSPHLTKSEVFVSFSPSSGSIPPGKSATVKITVVLLEEAQFFKIFKIQTFWPDLSYACFIPLLIAQTCPSHAPSMESLKEMAAATSNVTSVAALDEAKRKMSLKFPKASLHSIESTKIEFDPTLSANTAAPSTLSSSVPNASYFASAMSSHGTAPTTSHLSSASASSSIQPAINIYKDFWKIPFEDLKPKRRLGGTQAGVSLCSLYGADVVLKKWDIGSLDPVPPEFVLEFEALRTLRHPNLVQFIGAQATQGVAFVVTEYVPKGTLQDLFQSGELRKKKGTLRTSRTSTLSTLSTQGSYSPYGTLSTSSSNLMTQASSLTGSPSALNPLAPNESPRGLASSSSSYNAPEGNPLQASLHRNPLTTSSNSQSSPPQTASGWSHAGSPSQGYPGSLALCKAKLGIAADVASAMAYMHYNSRMHRDLKSLNILVDEGFRAKIADLGSSKSWSAHSQMTSGVGSYDWIAPEVVASRAYSPAADVFSFGLVLWEIVHEQFPDRPMDMVARGGIPPIDPERFAQMFPDPGSISALEFERLITRCCDIEPDSRPTFAEIVILLEQILTSPLSTTPRRTHSRAPSNGGNPFADAITEAKRSGSSGLSASSLNNSASGDLWIRAMKSTSSSVRNSANITSTPYLSSMPSSPSSPHALGSASPIATSGLSSDELSSEPNISPPQQEDSYLTW